MKNTKEKSFICSSTFFLLFNLEALHFHFALSHTNYVASSGYTLLFAEASACASLAADPKPIARTQSHNNVTFCECLVVTHSSRPYISHLSECKVKVAIFIEQNPGKIWNSAHLYAPLHLRHSAHIINLSSETCSFAVLTQINDKY